MIDGAFFDQDQVTKFGNPWHGVLRDGVIHLPTGATRPLPGAVPENHDSFAIAVPGLPEVSTDATETALGMTWLNYAIASGTNHVLYGVALGSSAWVYVDPNNRPWKCTATITAAGAATFVLVRLDDQTVSQTINVSVSPAPTFNTAGYDVLFEDVASHGRAAVFAWEQPFESPPHQPKKPRYAKCYAEVVISGTPPAASAQFLMRVEKTGATTVDKGTELITDQWFNVVETFNEEEWLTSRTADRDFEETEVVGMMYSQLNNLLPVQKRFKTETRGYTKTWNEGSSAYEYGGAETDFGTLECGGVVSDPIVTTFIYSGTAPGRQQVGDWSLWGDLATRYSNKCYGLHELSVLGTRRYSRFVSFSGKYTSNSFTAGSDVPPTAVAHPFSGAIRVYGGGLAVHV